MRNELSNTSVKAGIYFGCITGLIYAASLYFLNGWAGLVGGLIMGMISGVFFGIIIYFFLRYSQNKIQEREEASEMNLEGLIFQGAANHFKGLEAVGGKLYLTETHLKFMSHNLNIQNHEWEVSLTRIERIEKAKSIGLLNNRINVYIESGEKEIFVLNQQQKWYDILSSKTNTL